MSSNVLDVVDLRLQFETTGFVRIRVTPYVVRVVLHERIRVNVVVFSWVSCAYQLTSKVVLADRVVQRGIRSSLRADLIHALSGDLPLLRSRTSVRNRVEIGIVVINGNM